MNVLSFFSPVSFLRLSFALAALGTEGDPAPGEIVGRELDRHPVTGKNLDIVHPHLSRDKPQDYMSVLEFHPKGSIWEVFDHLSLHFNQIFFCHPTLPYSPDP